MSGTETQGSYGNIQSLSKVLHQFFKKQGKSVDRGVPERIWPEQGPPRLKIVGAKDGTDSQTEILQEAFHSLKTIAFGRSEFETELCPSKSKPSLYCTFGKEAGTLLPWFLDDGDPKTKTDARLRKDVDRSVTEAHRSAKKGKADQGSKAYNMTLLKKLLRSLSTARKTGGLGIEYSSEEMYWADSGIDASVKQIGSCHGLSFLFFPRAQRAGLKPQFIRVSGQRDPETQEMQYEPHIAVAVVLDPKHPKQLTAVDPSDGSILSNKDNQWYPLSDLEMAAHYQRNIAFYGAPPSSLTPSEVLTWQENLLSQAEALAPNSFVILHDIAYFYRFIKKDEGKYEHYRDKACDKIHCETKGSFSVLWDDSQ